MARRSEITMTDQQVDEFIADRRVAVLATVQADGRPHLVPMWFAPEGRAIEVWSFGKAQKTVNLRRDPRATLLFETGTEYDQLRGVSLECDVRILDGVDDVERVGVAIAERYGTTSAGSIDEQTREALRAQAAKRVGLRFVPTRVISWDHRKLG